jgi:hypothetical protein
LRGTLLQGDLRPQVDLTRLLVLLTVVNIVLRRVGVHLVAVVIVV